MDDETGKKRLKGSPVYDYIAGAVGGKPSSACTRARARTHTHIYTHARVCT